MRSPILVFILRPTGAYRTDSNLHRWGKMTAWMDTVQVSWSSSARRAMRFAITSLSVDIVEWALRLVTTTSDRLQKLLRTEKSAVLSMGSNLK
jgi:hypothetical protein